LNSIVPKYQLDRKSTSRSGFCFPETFAFFLSKDDIVMGTLIVPPSIEEVIKGFDATGNAVDEQVVCQTLGAARQVSQHASDAENLGAWSEVVAFALTANAHHTSPWKTYFGPTMSGTKEDGTAFHSPDIAEANAAVIEHWADRARSITHPVLKARYADLVWDMSRAIAKVSPDASMARIAIDSYLDSVASNLRVDAYNRYQAAIRALDLALVVNDNVRRDRGRESLLQLHREAMAAERGLWWMACDRLLNDKRAAVTDAEREQLLADLEFLMARFSNAADAAVFDPHATEAVAKRLLRYHNRVGRLDDVKRVSEILARTFERFASLGNSMVASYALQIAVNAYRQAGLPQESRRVRVAMEDKIAQSRDELKPTVVAGTIQREDMDAFTESLLAEDVATTFARICASFLDRRQDVEKQIETLAKDAPLMARISQSIIQGSHIAAKIGSLEDDPFGRLIQGAARSASLSDVWLVNALYRAIEAQDINPGHFAAWAARGGMYDDLTLLVEGAAAYFSEDYYKSVHILVPQVERGLRGIVSQLGLPVTKPHPTISGAGVVIGMGEFLYSKEVTEALGPDLTLYFLANYADPRGFNLRNRIAHGMMDVGHIALAVASRVMHTLLVIGMWKELAEARR
jgi:hypothetical protein